MYIGVRADCLEVSDPADLSDKLGECLQFGHYMVEALIEVIDQVVK